MLGLVSWPLRGKHIQNLHRHEHPWTIQANSTSGPPCHWFGSDPGGLHCGCLLWFSSFYPLAAPLVLELMLTLYLVKEGILMLANHTGANVMQYLRQCSTDPHPPTWSTLIAWEENSSQAWRLLLGTVGSANSCTQRRTRIVRRCFSLQVAALDLPFSNSYRRMLSPPDFATLYSLILTWHVLRTEPVPSVSTRTVSVDPYRQCRPLPQKGVPIITMGSPNSREYGDPGMPIFTGCVNFYDTGRELKFFIV